MGQNTTFFINRHLDDFFVGVTQSATKFLGDTEARDFRRCVNRKFERVAEKRVVTNALKREAVVGIVLKGQYEADRSSRHSSRAVGQQTVYRMLIMLIAFLAIRIRAFERILNAIDPIPKLKRHVPEFIGLCGLGTKPAPVELSQRAFEGLPLSPM